MPRPSMLSAVTFDLDGLMVNTEELYDEVMTELCRRRTLVFTREARVRMMGRPGEKAFVELIDYHQLREDPFAMMEEADLVFTVLLEARLALMPGLLDLLAALEAADIPKGIATSSRLKYLEYVLGRFDLTPRFDFLITAENVTEGKPHPEVYLAAAARHGVVPETMMVLEDSQNGCRAAVAAGAYAVAVPGDHSRDHDFAGAKIIADSLADRRIYEALGL